MSEKSREILKKTNDLPTLPTVIYELNQVINDPMSSVHEVENLVINDQAISSKILTLANSAFYSISGGVSSLKRAISVLGFNTVNELVLSMSVLRMFSKENSSFNVNDFWLHSLGVAYCASSVDQYINKHSDSDLFSCGLLHDIGKIAFYSVDQKEFLKIYEAAETKKSCFLVEEKLADYNTAFIGSELEKRWKLPLVIQKTTYYNCQNYFKAKNDFMLDKDSLQAIDIVNLSNSLINQMKFGNDGSFNESPVDPQVIKRLRLTDQDLIKIHALVKQSLFKADKFLQILKND